MRSDAEKVQSGLQSEPTFAFCRVPLWKLLACVFLLVCFVQCAAADIATALAALDRRDYDRAIKELEPLAQAGEPEAQYFLGGMYLLGQGVPRNKTTAYEWFLRSASRGNANAQYSIGYAYYTGDDLPKDRRKAAEWILKAAGQGEHASQLLLAFMYANGEGVIQDLVQAHLWANLAALSDVRKIATDAGDLREALARDMTKEQLAQAQDMARKWRPIVTLDPRELDPPPNTTVQPREAEPVGNGTGFFVSAEGHVLTNHHVVDGCTMFFAKNGVDRRKLSLVARDAENDLALLRLSGSATFVLPFSSARLRVGQDVVVLGYPLQGLLASSMSLTAGTISALAGIQDDTRMIQITAPIQPGNSGGPLLNQSGEVVGVVTSKLNALKAARILGDVPQNINFAIKGSVAQTFLDSNGINYVMAASVRTLPRTDIGEQSRKAVVLVECWR